MVPFDACVGRTELVEEADEELFEEKLLEEELLDEVLSAEELLLDRAELTELLPGVIDTLFDLLPPPPPPQAVRVTARPTPNSRPFKVTGLFILAPKL